MEVVQPKVRDKGLWRDLIAYWILGLCNNLGFVVMLSAAHDIIEQFHAKVNSEVETKLGTREESAVPVRYCHLLSTGAILLADILPSLSVKIILPFCPLWIHVRMAGAVFASALGFFLVGFAQAEWVAILGVVSTSASSGLGETSLLAYSAYLNRNVISTWSSGTGGAGIVGSLIYASLRALGVSASNTMMVMLLFPISQALSFWVLLRKPGDVVPQEEEVLDDTEKLKTFPEKLKYTLKILNYMVPLCLVYFFEYFINMGLFELAYFKNEFISPAAQYRWYNVDYQIGVFISRSSVNIFPVKRIWLMAVFQGINTIYFITEVLWFYTPSIWIVVAVVFWEGLLGGGGYVNTFYKITKEVEPNKREFTMSMVSQSDSMGIMVAGFLAMPVHNAICELPEPVRY